MIIVLTLFAICLLPLGDFIPYLNQISNLQLIGITALVAMGYSTLKSLISS